MRKFFSLEHVAPWMAIAFLLWVYAFWGFLSGRLGLVEDAVSYYDHTKYFIDSLLAGSFPLWDTVWHHGAPNDFFLQRIGAYNPFYFLIVILRLLGVGHTHAYLSFLAFYYFLGMIGFYLLALRLYKDHRVAFAGFLLLLFSALGTRLFDSYMMLVTVPIIWFFYCLVAFTQTPSKGFFLGLVLTVGILMTTYIPFYFLIFLGIFIGCFILFFKGQLREVTLRYLNFLKKNWCLVAACAVLLIASLMPLAIFYSQSSQGTIALPGRHGLEGEKHVLTVPLDTLKWGTLEDILYSSYFSDLQRYKFAIIYIPFIALIFLLLGIKARINRQFILLFSCALVLLCVIIPQLPFHAILYKYLFFMKYFRNLHFFLWFVLIPLFVLLVLESFKSFMEAKPEGIKERRGMLFYTLAVHAVALFFVWWRADAIVSTYIVILLSTAFFSAFVLGKIKSRIVLFLGLTVMIVLQPLEVYHYLAQKGVVISGKSYYQYDRVKDGFPFVNSKVSMNPKDYAADKGGLYYASKAFNDLHMQADNYALAVYLKHKLILTDKIPVVDGANPHLDLDAIRIENNSELLSVESYKANKLRVKTNLPARKLLIYNDSYDARWKVFVNGKEEVLIRVNEAFKGVWVPEGQSIVEFRFGSWGLLLLHLGLLFGFCVVLLGGIYCWRFKKC